MVAESILLIEREELAGPDYYPTHPGLQKWAHEAGSAYIGDQKVKVTRPRLRDVEQGEVPIKSYARLHATGDFSEELLENILRGISAQKYSETVLGAARAFGGGAVCRVPQDGGADGPQAEGLPNAVLGGVHAVCALPGHRPPGWRGLSRRTGCGPERREDGLGVLARLLRESRDL